MKDITNLFQTADWKKEKHVPVIDAPATVKKGEFFEVTVTIGKEIAHPNKTEHHISWIEVFFQPESEKFPYNLGKFDFLSHGASTQGPDTNTVYTHHEARFKFKTDKPGTIFVFSYCNIHGLWKNSYDIKIA